MKNENDDDIIEVEDKEKKSGIMEEIEEAAVEMGAFFKKVGNKIADKSKEINQNIKQNMDKNTALKDALATYTIAGLKLKIKAFNGSETERAIYIKQDDKNLESVLSGTILVDEDNRKILITQINKKRVVQKTLIVNGKEEFFPCFRAEYEVYDAAAPKIDKVEYKA